MTSPEHARTPSQLSLPSKTEPGSPSASAVFSARPQDTGKRPPGPPSDKPLDRADTQVIGSGSNSPSLLALHSSQRSESHFPPALSLSPTASSARSDIPLVPGTPLSSSPSSLTPKLLSAPSSKVADTRNRDQLSALIPSMDEETAAYLIQECETFKRRRQRGRVIAEILSTEESYVQQLTVLDTVFMTPLIAMLPPKTIETIFTNVRSIKQMNEEFLADLSSAEKSMGAIFLAFAPFLQLYHGYAKGTAKAHRAVTQLLATNPKFAEFHTTASQQAKGMNLNSLLITPIQRVPRYKLLLTELLKTCEEHNPDINQLRSALEEISKAAVLINEAVRAEEHREGLKEVEERFSTKISLEKPDRKFFQEGVLVKVCRREPKPFTFFLFSDLLIYGVEAKATGKVRVSKTINIDNHFSVKALDNEEQKKGGKPLWSWQVLSAAKSFVAVAQNEEEFNKWYPKMQELSKSNVSSGTEAPVWTADKEAVACVLCSNKFTLTNRRHHCRMCGTLVCGGCSQGRVELPLEAGTKVRVCDNCMSKDKEVKEQETVAIGIVIQGIKKDPQALFEGELRIRQKGVSNPPKGGFYFVLRLNQLGWYKTPSVLKPTGTLELEPSKDQVSAIKDPDAADAKEFSFQLNASGKNMCLVCDSQSIRDKWVTAIMERHALAKAPDVGVKKDSASIREGFLFKMGGTVANWKYRYVVLGEKDLCYFKNLLDMEPAGVVPLSKGVALQEEAMVKSRPKEFPFSITPSGSARKWLFTCKTEQERTDWIDAIRQRGHGLNPRGTLPRPAVK